MAHTPKPWEAEPGAGRGAWIKGANEEWAALACGDTDESARANAKLIAAAPDLLAALRHALIIIEDRAGKSPMATTREYAATVRAEINAAITKATE